MKSGLRLRRLGVILSLCSTVANLHVVHAQTPVEPVPAPVSAVDGALPVDGAPAADATAPAEIVDVAADNGTLIGEVRNQQGRLLAGRQVRVLFQGTEVASTTTGANGTFRVCGVREGVHEVLCCDQTCCIRVWPKETAPPQSGCTVCIVCDECADPVARQVRRPTRRRGFLGNAFATYPIATAALLGAGLGTAIVVPTATSQKPGSP